jgi:hypothetical protein
MPPSLPASSDPGAAAAAKRQLLERLLRERAGRAEPLAGASATPIEAPLSSAQARIWFFEELRPGTSMFTVPFVLRLSGALDVAAFEAALQTVIGRHAVFQTVIERRDDGPVQVVRPNAHPATLHLIDLSAAPDDQRAAEADRCSRDFLRRPFDLARGPLFRAGLVRVAATAHVFLLPMHHLICDGWSVQLITQELAAAYTSIVTGAAAALPAIGLQYAEFARQQQEALASGAFGADLGYWKERLAAAPPTTELPTDFPRVTGQIAAGAVEHRVMAGDLRDGIRAMARQHEVTLFMAMLATFNCLLLRLTGQDDLILGVPVAGRSPDAEPLVGCFINHVALRSDLSGDPTFAEALQRVRQSALGAYAHQDVPFERVVEELHPARDPGRRPYFQIQFNMTFAACERLELPGVVATPGAGDDDWSRYDLAVFFIEFEQGIAWRVVYNRELYARSTVVSLMDRFERLLAQVTTDPHQPVSGYSLLIDSEQESLAGAFGGDLE